MSEFMTIFQDPYLFIVFENNLCTLILIFGNTITNINMKYTNILHEVTSQKYYFISANTPFVCSYYI